MPGNTGGTDWFHPRGSTGISARPTAGTSEAVKRRNRAINGDGLAFAITGENGEINSECDNAGNANC
jgi:hypothetical protein